jgi:uncharacterized membrane protein
MQDDAPPHTSESPGPRNVIVEKITTRDIGHAIVAGMRDILAAPILSLSFGLVYAAFGWLIIFLMIGLEWGSYAYPLATGFALVAPIAAAGLYGISEQLERGERPSWAQVANCLYGRRGEATRFMAVVTTFAYIIWLDIAAAIYVAFWGMKALRFREILEAAFTTPYGLAFLLIGNGIGALLALAVFAIMVISLPLLFDRKIDFVTAMITSVKSVLKNPIPMLLWCATIGVLLLISFASAFVALIVIFPLLGHATWHLYRRVVKR